MLLDGFNHVAILTNDTDRFVAFYREVFDAEVTGSTDMDGHGQLTFVQIGGQAEINLFQVQGNVEAQRQTPMFGRGRIDHLALQAASLRPSRTYASGSSNEARPTSSSPTSARYSPSSFGTRTASRVRSASPIPMRGPAP